MKVQVIKRDGEPEYAVLPWADYLALLQASGQAAQVPQAAADAVKPALSELTRLREAKALTLQELARSVGISPHYLGMIESAERQPDAAIKRALAWALGVAGWEEKL
ncbi:helix-turn-helix transcriptional regulator [Pseudomonas sp. SA3-5]|uniref:Helix-turn-helix transcriptional regulator n=1 Tax=Pseudomonas aestuarii TaxID=3018340 RepID=A0ABT4XCJ0_9PSED|nr:helix-turn-helix transcriptional regulator [Pseudomonas aestuarii]MDA7085898.1 helix-turn-helix transcriptional regulator [Pseudomonas aestuarii]